MHLVALTTLEGSPEAEAPRLAKDLGVTAYEAGQLLRGLFPSVVLRTADEARARALCAALRARGHGAAACSPAEVTSSRAMYAPQSFRLEPAAFIASLPPGPEAPLSWTSVQALVRATHVAQVTQVGVEKGRAFSPGKALLSGGVLLTKAVERETRAQVTEKEPVLYLFHPLGPPWLLTESRLKYEGLGPLLKPGRSENFLTLVRLLRERAPQATYDERLLQFRGAPATPNSPETIDLLAHLIATV